MDLKETRLALSISQREMAARMGYKNAQTISDKENGRKPVTERDRRLLDAMILEETWNRR